MTVRDGEALSPASGTRALPGNFCRRPLTSNSDLIRSAPASLPAMTLLQGRDPHPPSMSLAPLTPF
jgi:hypothetical protein